MQSEVWTSTTAGRHGGRAVGMPCVARVAEDIADKPPGVYRLIHTADWHLGKMLVDHSREEEHGRFLAWLIGVARAVRADAILVAGDVFDASIPPQSAQAQYYDFVAALFAEGGGRALAVIGGNHDSPALLEAPGRALRALNTHVAGTLADEPSARVLFLPDSSAPAVAIAMVPFLRDRDLRVGRAGEGAAEIREALVSGIRRRYDEVAEAVADARCPVVAAGHLTVLHAVASDAERDIHIGGLGAVSPDVFPASFAHVALGHLHRPQEARGSGGRVWYAGSPIPLSFGEAGDQKQVGILDVAGGGVTRSALAVPRFRQLAQIRTKVAGIDDALRGFDPAAGDLRAWVEVVVEDAAVEADLDSRVRSAAAGRGFDVLKVTRAQRAAAAGGMWAAGATDGEALDDWLADPGRVFEHLLAGRLAPDDPGLHPLRLAFRQLLEIEVGQREPEEREGLL